MTGEKGVSEATVTSDKKLCPCFSFSIHSHRPAGCVDRRTCLGLDDVHLQFFDHHYFGVRELSGHQHVFQVRHCVADGTGQVVPGRLPSRFAGFVGNEYFLAQGVDV